MLFIRFGIFMLLSYCCHGFNLDCPQECHCVDRNYDCSDQDLTEVPKRIDKIAKSINLQKNQITELSKNSFLNFQLVRQLNLGFNLLKEIMADDFIGLLNLRTLDLSFNEITTIHKNAFKSLEKINDITLKGNKLSNIDGVFMDLVGLTRLDLSDNLLESLTSETFKNMTDLRYLILASNQITAIHLKAFYDIRRITYISMSGNPISNVNGLFTKNNILSFVELTNCSLESFPKGLPLIVRFLYLDQNDIMSITKKEMERVESLMNLFLSENKLKSVEKDAFTGLNSLMELWINFNFITEIPVVSVSARKLYLDNNQITSMEKEDFPFGSQLETLSIKNNQISLIEKDVFENLKNLKLLYLGGNQISVIPDFMFKSLPLLDELGLTGMDIDYIGQEAFAGLSNLQKLTVSFVLIRENALQGNVFKHLTNLKFLDLQESPELTKKILESTEILQSLFTLEELNLMDNELQTLNSSLMTYMPRLILIKLGGNEFHCDRRLLWLWKWIDMQKYKFQDPDALECFSPPELHGSSLLSLQSDQFAPTTLKPVYLSTKGQPQSKISPNIRFNSSEFENETFSFEKINNSDFETTLPPYDDTTSSFIYDRNSLNFQNKQRKLYEDQFNKILLVTVVTSIPVVLFVVIATAVVCLKCNRRKQSYTRTDTFPENDVTFYVISDEAPPLPPPNSTRKDRGSVSSTRDITGDNVFTIDNDSS